MIAKQKFPASTQRVSLMLDRRLVKQLRIKAAQLELTLPRLIAQVLFEWLVVAEGEALVE